MMLTEVLVWDKVITLFSGVVIGLGTLWVAIAKGWVEGKKVNIDVRKGEIEIEEKLGERRNAILKEERDTFEKLYRETKEMLVLSQEQARLEQHDCESRLKELDRKYNQLSEQYNRLLYRLGLTDEFRDQQIKGNNTDDSQKQVL